MRTGHGEVTALVPGELSGDGRLDQVQSVVVEVVEGMEAMILIRGVLDEQEYDLGMAFHTDNIVVDTSGDKYLAGD